MFVADHCRVRSGLVDGVSVGWGGAAIARDSAVAVGDGLTTDVFPTERTGLAVASTVKADTCQPL